MNDIKKTSAVKKAVAQKVEPAPIKATEKTEKIADKATSKPKAKAKQNKKEKKRVAPTSIIARLKKLIAKKKKHPTFRGRFGIRQIRSKAKDKFNKWRVPRGIDIKWRKGDGCRVKGGYKNPEEIRGLHPSGYRETKVCNVKDLDKVQKETHAARISSTVGKKKKEFIRKEAEKKGIKVLN
ncbi:MAG: hypothetical protein COT55_00860 [Candidatus Diapherotrites archaeon CG09_land_8_20_14_0_10_32_12]|nr:MAG: hypothetical protein COT55_00860 [Candidatus Diapherotrites archaeon CG09_land_8_20_14_0_10_32_12]